MSRIPSILAASGLGVALLGACSNDQGPTAPTAVDGAAPATKSAGSLKVTPPQLSFSATGATATLSASSPVAGPINVAISTPACVTVSPKSTERKQSKFTVTATVSGACTLTITDAGTGSVTVPVTVAAQVVRSTLTHGNFHTCGLVAGGAAWCWGYNGFGQLGNAAGSGSVGANPTPVAVGGGLSFTTLTAGSYHTCGLTAAGAAWCWGRNELGQLGNSTNVGELYVANIDPLPVAGALTFVSIEAGNSHTCGLTSAGATYCWGRNRTGQLGTTTNNDTETPNPTPAPITGAPALVALSAGADHTCGITGVGETYCWGDNRYGQLGNTTNNGIELAANPAPTAVAGVPALASLSAGGAYTCGLTSAGAAWCWGDNYYAELGTTTNNGNPVANPTPAPVVGAPALTNLVTGGGHTCGLNGTTAYCWGGNLLGQLGVPTNSGTTVPTPTPTAVPGLSLVALSANAAHTCGVTASGTAYCWGFNRYGQIGRTTNAETDNPNPTPETVLGGLTFATQ